MCVFLGIYNLFLKSVFYMSVSSWGIYGQKCINYIPLLPPARGWHTPISIVEPCCGLCDPGFLSVLVLEGMPGLGRYLGPATIELSRIVSLRIGFLFCFVCVL